MRTSRENIYISAGPLVGHTAVEDAFRYKCKYTGVYVFKYKYIRHKYKYKYKV